MYCICERALLAIHLLCIHLGTKHAVARKHLDRVRKGCIVANMGHSNHEIDVDGLKGLKRERVRRNVTTYQWPSGKRIFLLAEVRLLCFELRLVPSLLSCLCGLVGRVPAWQAGGHGLKCFAYLLMTCLATLCIVQSYTFIHVPTTPSLPTGPSAEPDMLQSPLSSGVHHISNTGQFAVWLATHKLHSAIVQNLIFSYVQSYVYKDVYCTMYDCIYSVHVHVIVVAAPPSSLSYIHVYIHMYVL